MSWCESAPASLKRVTFYRPRYQAPGEPVTFDAVSGYIGDEPGWDGLPYTYRDAAHAARNGYHLSHADALAWELAYWGRQYAQARERIRLLHEAGAAGRRPC